MLFEALRILAPALGAWLAVRVELRWMRADIRRNEADLSAHDARIRQLEIRSK